MLSTWRTVIVPLYVFACVILGGSAQGIWQNMILQIVGVAIIAWAAIGEMDHFVSPSAKQLLFIGVLALAVVAVQMIPLPARVWSVLGPRARIADGFRTLGMTVPPLPVSLTPASGLNSLFSIIPPLAIFSAMVRLKAYRPQWLAIALIAGTMAGVILGALQVSSADPVQSPFYLYDDTNWGRAVGFFANADHMATLLVVTIPFLAATVASRKTASMQRFSAVVAVGAGLSVVVLVGIVLNGSLAGYGLALPVIAASTLIVLPRSSKLRLWIVAAGALLLIGSIAGLETTSIGAGKLGQHATSAAQSRAEILSTTTRAAVDFMPFGSGFGSFQKVYPLYEHPEEVATTYVVHAHDDYAELILELGVAGILLIALFLVWWATAVWNLWRTAEGGAFGRAAAIASAAILVHSLVDFPLRTAAIGACFAMCIALLADGRSAPANEERQLRRSRHVVL